MEYCILVVNPGSTSTKIAVFQGEKALLQKTIRHSGEELAPFGAIMDQAPFRLRCVEIIPRGAYFDYFCKYQKDRA